MLRNQKYKKWLRNSFNYSTIIRKGSKNLFKLKRTFGELLENGLAGNSKFV